MVNSDAKSFAYVSNRSLQPLLLAVRLLETQNGYELELTVLLETKPMICYLPQETCVPFITFLHNSCSESRRHSLRHVVARPIRISIVLIVISHMQSDVRGLLYSCCLEICRYRFLLLNMITTIYFHSLLAYRSHIMHVVVVLDN